MILDQPPGPWAIIKILLSWVCGHLLLLGVIVLTGGTLRLVLVRQRHRRLTRGGRCVEIHTPPRADLASAQALWSNLIGLLRPAWRRALFGQPHVAFEYLFSAEGVRIRLWIPSAVPKG